MIVDCRHGTDGNLSPCPSLCPCQAWPRYMFRLTLIKGRWKLRRKYRDAEVVRRWRQQEVTRPDD